jgi:hypothetical protein
MLLIYTSHAGSILREMWKSISNHEMNMQETITEGGRHNRYTMLTFHSLKTAIPSDVSPCSLATYEKVSA